MNIESFRVANGLSQSEFAQRMTEAGSPATQSLVSQWERGDVKPPPERWSFIEKVTGGAVDRKDLRPDIWPPEQAGDPDPDTDRVVPFVENP